MSVPGGLACWPWSPGSSSHRSTAVVTDTPRALIVVFIPIIVSRIPVGHQQQASCGTNTHRQPHAQSRICQTAQYKQSGFVSPSRMCLVWVLVDRFVLLKNVMSKSNSIVMVLSPIFGCPFYSGVKKGYWNVFTSGSFYRWQRGRGRTGRLAETVSSLDKERLRVAKVTLPWNDQLDTKVNTPHIMAPCLIKETFHCFVIS